MSEKQYKLRVAKMSDAQQIHEIMESVSKGLTDQSLFLCDDLEYVKEQIAKTGFAVVAEDTENGMAGSLVCRIPGENEDNLGYDTGLTQEERRTVIHMESAFVLPEHRGHHLQQRLLTYAEELCREKKFHYLMATVSPDNPASLSSLTSMGYKVMVQKEKYGGWQRMIMQKEI